MDTEKSECPTPDLSGLGARIAKIADLVGGKKNLAHIISISESQLYRYISGDSQPTVEPLAAIAQSGNVHLDWLVLGDGPTGLSAEINDPSNLYNAPQQFISIAEYQDPNPSIQPEQSIHNTGKPTFNSQWLRVSGLNPDHLRLACAGDDSMSATINHGDLLLIDITQNRYSGDGIYLLRLENHVLAAKRLQYTLDNGLYLINDNPAYKDQLISDKQKSSITIIGRIVWTAGLI